MDVCVCVCVLCVCGVCVYRYAHFHPYQPLILVEKYANVLFQQCEVRNFGGKCIVARTFSQITLEWCTVGGSCGERFLFLKSMYIYLYMEWCTVGVSCGERFFFKSMYIYLYMEWCTVGGSCGERIRYVN
jgi:hypothetical protein